MFSKIPDKRLETCFIEALAHPVERRTEVVYQFLAGERLSDFVCEACSLGHIGSGGLEPEEIRVGRKCEGALGRGGEAGAVMVESFAGAWDIAGPAHGALGEGVG